MIVKIVAIAFLFATVKTRDDLIYYGVYLVVGVVGGNIFNLFYLRKYIKRRFIEIRELRPMKHLSPSIRIFMISVITSIYLQLDTIMLGFMQGNECGLLYWRHEAYQTVARRHLLALRGFVAEAFGTCQE